MCVTFSSLLISQDDTEVCKQTFSWLSRYAEMTHRINPSMYLFYIWDRHNVRETADKLTCTTILLLIYCIYITCSITGITVHRNPSKPTNRQKTIFFPQLADSSVYAADQVNSSWTPDNTDPCRKYLSSHPKSNTRHFHSLLPTCNMLQVWSHEIPRAHTTSFWDLFHSLSTASNYHNNIW